MKNKIFDIFQETTQQPEEDSVTKDAAKVRLTTNNTK